MPYPKLGLAQRQAPSGLPLTSGQPSEADWPSMLLMHTCYTLLISCPFVMLGLDEQLTPHGWRLSEPWATTAPAKAVANMKDRIVMMAVWRQSGV